MKKYIIITVDTNDADYVTGKEPITDTEIEIIKPVIKEIKKNDGDFSTNEMGGSGRGLYGHLDGYDLFYDFCPKTEYGFHTIESVEIITVTHESKLL